MLPFLLVLLNVLAITFGLHLPPNESRIIGGSNADIAKFPYQVSLRLKSGYAFEHNCGGSIYNERVIVTAAHCLLGYSPTNLRIVAGVSSLNAITEFLQIDRLVVNSAYSSTTINFDVGLIILAKPLVFSPSIQPIELAFENPNAGKEAIVTGWGTTSEGGSISEVLQEVAVVVVEKELCAASYGPNTITENMICAGVAAGGKDACHGDSGGPMVVDDQLVGIVSWGRGCGRVDIPKVYSSVASLRKWIEENAAVYS